MAKYRQIHTTFWNDPLILDLTPEQKYFYLYLLTNPNVKQCGIYEISIRQMTYHTGYNTETIEKLLDMFVKLNKIVLSKKTNEIALINFLKYNYSASPKVKTCVEKELDEVKNKDLIKYIYSIDTLNIEYGNNNKNKNNNNKKENNNNKNVLPTTEISFKNYVNELDHKEHHQNFIDYWCETNSAGKMRYMLEKTFSIEKRLNRWASNQFATKKKNGMPDFYDNAYVNRIKDDQTMMSKYRKHLMSLGYEQKMSYNGTASWVLKK
tara:strand:- start:1611 stop:2405 length:795 start_codon:yes stop_codon:yes gene_type:complete